ncbi:catalytic phage domain protein : Integrase, catalytic core, phage domain protein OS=Rhodopirellula sallentina SM41 GN=RSSM_06627 PE=4 SV=1: Phage_integrase [Gemmataceae bacterium]|nr:catalytic phage domain protein : Integrase, catalytic core, phage domain protein OS=Rhodopirellula sallentina SM41 GN=RSSM_06627 PE=4 SV=1: Phage_integrase [Gemmataceae bacterium]VTU01492.1 catalytic phage domain protein : Integrase, catalytic core, phage domain protein OS=Rhodopirellula sallentina SM41 GN=RSSM_06627 PE=4 SV=1: Phage_integrase [Gemmataceae bacterium]
MARPKNSVPTYRLHKPSNTARCWVAGKWVTLGKYNSPESRAEYARILAEHAVAPCPTGPVKGHPDVTVNEVLLGFLRHADAHYRRADGTPTNEVPQYKQTFRLVRELYGHTPAREFGPLALKALRQKMIDAGWSRKLINQRVGRVRRVFKWAVENELVDVSVLQALAAVQGLQEGRTAAKEMAPVEPVAEEHVVATLPFLRPAVRAMVQVQLLTGMRPGEVSQLRPRDIDAANPVWQFRPVQYKTRHRGKERVVAIGPRAQRLLSEFAPADRSGYYFSPRRVVEQFHAERAANRKTPRASALVKRNATQRKVVPVRGPAEKYTVTSYDRAIRRAVVKANARRERLAGMGNFDPVPHWHPNQLRHAQGTRVRHQFGLEAAQVVLGHARADVTEVYAERDVARAARVAAEIG